MASHSRLHFLQAVGGVLWLIASCGPDIPPISIRHEQAAERSAEPSEQTPIEPEPAPEARLAGRLPRAPGTLRAEVFDAPRFGERPPPSYPRPCADVYDEDLLPTYEVEISEDDWKALQSDARSGRKVYRPITFKYGDEVHPDAMIRWKGNNSRCNDKLQFSIAFHKKDERGRFHGLRRISLDHGGCHLFEERLVMSFARDLGLPALCINHARLVVNGEYHGLFVNQEVLNKDFLARNFAEHDGNLYKKAEELKTNEGRHADVSDIEAFWAARQLGELEELIDVEQAVSFWAFEAVMGAQDNFVLEGRNYYVYNHPQRGFLYLPYDMDQGMPSRPGDGTAATIWPAFHHPADVVLADPHWRARYEEEVRRIAEAYDPDAFAERLDRWWDQVREATEDDPAFVYPRKWLENLKDGIRERAEYLERFLD